ncbi:MAG: hypothetical protein ABIP95_12135 [Pelobium sp.]
MAKKFLSKSTRSLWELKISRKNAFFIRKKKELMGKSYFFNIGIILSSLLFFSSCADKSIVDFKDKASYIDYLKGESESDLKLALAKDTLYLKTRIDSVKDIVFYEDFSMSPTTNDETEKPILKPVKKFGLTNADSIKQAFLLYNKTLRYTQKYALPNSKFSFYTPEASDFLLDRNVTHKITTLYLGKNKAMLTALRSSKPDSLIVKTSYRYPTKFETLTINKATKKVAYKDFEIVVDKIDKGVVNLSLPGKLAPEILGCQALNKEGILMDSYGYYSYPNRGLSNKTLSDLNLLKSALIDAIESNTQEKALAMLNKIPENVFKLMAEVNSFNADIMNVDENADDSELMVEMDNINEKYIGILGVKKQQIKMYFDDEVENLYLFIASESHTLTANIIAKSEEDETSN